MNIHKKKHVNRITNSVMDIYKRVNPSYVENLGLAKEKRKYILTWGDLITKKLQVPPLFFQKSRLLDVGCGSGEKSLIYAILGADVLGLDVNEKTVELANKRAKEWGLEEKVVFQVRSVFDLDMKESFDIVVSDGMIFITADPKEAFVNLAKLIKPGGILILGIAESCGFFQRSLQRYFVNKIAGQDEEAKLKVAMALFKDKFERASAVSGRSVEAVVYDTIIHPHIVPLSLLEIEEWMREFDIQLDCTWPPSSLPLVSDSQYHAEFSSSHKAVLGWRNLSRLIWLLKRDFDKDIFVGWESYNLEIQKFIKNISNICKDNYLDIDTIKELVFNDPKIGLSPLPKVDVETDIRIFFKEVLNINKEIEKMQFKEMPPEEIARSLKIKRVFSGFHGVGMVYIRGTRNIKLL